MGFFDGFKKLFSRIFSRNTERDEEKDYTQEYMNNNTTDADVKKALKSKRRRGWGWIIAAGVVAALSAIAIPLASVMAGPTALTATSVLAGAVIIAAVAVGTTMLALTRKAIYEGKAAKKIEKSPEKAAEAIKRAPAMTKYLTNQYGKEAEITPEKLDKASAENHRRFVEFDGVEQDIVDKFMNNEDLTVDERVKLAKGMRPADKEKDSAVRQYFDDATVGYGKPYKYECLTITRKDGASEVVETVDLEGVGAYTYQGHKAYEQQMSNILNVPELEGKLEFTMSGIKGKKQKATLDEGKEKRTTEALAESAAFNK